MKKHKTQHSDSPDSAAAIILDYISSAPNSAFSFRLLSKKVNATSKAEKLALAQILKELTEQGEISMLADGSFRSTKSENFLIGNVQFVNQRFAFIINSDAKEDIKVSAENLNFALDGDQVKVRLFTNGRTRKPEGEVVEVISRYRSTFVGRIELREHFAFVTPDNKRTWSDIFVSKENTMNARTGDKVTVQISEWGTRERNPVGKVTQVLGAAGENDTEMHAIMAEFDLPVDFEQEVQTAAEEIPETIPQSEIDRRRDFRNVTTFTIDPVDAKDFDDALSFLRLPNGNLEIGVHIADVSHYVSIGSTLDKEAYRRGTSVYLVDRTVPMLPEKLSNFLCSLRPNEDKLVFSAVFEMNAGGAVVGEWYGRGIIHSDRRFAYEEVQEVIETGAGDFHEEIAELQRLALILREKRFRKGSIGFETPEVKFVLDERGKPLEVVPKIRKDAHKLIEDFMLLANKKVAEFIFNKRQSPRNTMVYRIHEAPNPEKIRIFGAFARKFGYKLSIEEKELPDSLNALIKALEGKPEEDVLQHLAVRTMSKARYSTEPLPHFGLAFEHYSHFTSPIRRYPDVLCHRLLQHYLDNGESVNKDALEDQCKHSSDMERRASEAERASIKYKQVEYMQMQDQDRVFAGIVSGVTEWGFYVEIVETKCEGLVRVVDLQDDFFELDAENFRLVGTRTKRIIAFGDKVEVKIKGTNIEKRTIDLVTVDKDLNHYMRMSSGDRNSSGRGRSGGGSSSGGRSGGGNRGGGQGQSGPKKGEGQKSGRRKR
ncbi:MAG: ribonuclease R [Bacteroidota bacterium]